MIQRILYFSFMIILLGCTSQNYDQGKTLYDSQCASCHRSDGEGLAKLYPPIKGSDYWREHLEDVPCIIRNGISDTITVNGVTFTTPMQGIPDLTEYEIANIISYIQHEWYPEDSKMDISQVKKSLGNCKEVY